MKIAVTGATGFVGHHLINRLQGKGHVVTALVHTTPVAPSYRDTVTPVRGAVEDFDSLKAAFAGADVVYHLVGIIAETKTKTFETTVVQGTRNVVTACQAENVGKLVYLSAVGTCAEAPSKYHRSKYQAEQAVISSELPYLILRSSVIYGPGDGFVSLVMKLIKALPVTPVIGSGKYRLQPIFVDDLTEIMHRELTTDAGIGQIVDVGGPDELEYLQILAIVKNVLSRKRLNFHLPTALMRLMASALEKLVKPAPLTRDQLVMMEMSNICDVTRMVELFGVRPISFADGLRRYVRTEND